MADPDVTFEVIVKDNLILSDQARRSVQNLTFEEAIDGSEGTVSLTIADSDDFILDPAILHLGAAFELRLAFHRSLDGPEAQVFVGEITKVDPEWSGESASTLQLVATDKSYRMKQRDNRARLFNHAVKDQAQSLLIDILALIYAYGMDNPWLNPVEELDRFVFTDEQTFTKKKEQTVWQVLAKIASDLNRYLFVRGNTLFLVDKAFLVQSQSTPKHRLIYRPTDRELLEERTVALKEFKPELDMAFSHDDIVAQGYSPVTEEPKIQTVQPTPSVPEERTEFPPAFDPRYRTEAPWPAWIPLDRERQKPSIPARIMPSSIEEPDYPPLGQYVDVYKDYSRGFSEEQPDRLFVAGVPPFGGDIEVEDHPATDAQADKLAEAALQKRLDNGITGTATVINAPFLRAGDIHTIIARGLGNFGLFYTGDYLLTKVTHSFGEDGFTTKIAYSRNILADIMAGVEIPG